MKIGILVTGHAPASVQERIGDYPFMFRSMLDGHGFDFETFNVVDMLFPSGPEAADGWLITGSRHGAYEDLPFITPLESLIRDIYDRGQPLVGVCFGHQIIAQALGGRVEKFAGGWAVGTHDYTLDGKPVTLNAWHQDQVITRPDSARLLGSSPFCENAMLAYGDHVWTVQAHPEFTSDVVEELIVKRGRGVVPDALLDKALANVSTPADKQAMADQMARIFKKEHAQ